MTNASTVILLPFLFAFLIFVGRFYGREGAYNKQSPSFLLAVLTILVALGYLVLGIVHWLPDYGTIGFGIAGLALLALSVFRLFQM